MEPVVAKPLDEEWQEVMERLGTSKQGDAFLSEFLVRVGYMYAHDYDIDEHGRQQDEGVTWRKRREERGLPIHELAQKVGVTSIDLWFMEHGIPPLTRARAEAVSDLDAALAGS